MIGYNASRSSWKDDIWPGGGHHDVLFDCVAFGWAICAVAVALASTVAFGVAARKTIALSINGDTQTVTTYAMSVTRLLEERGVDVKSHDLVQSTSGDHPQQS